MIRRALLALLAAFAAVSAPALAAAPCSTQAEWTRSALPYGDAYFNGSLAAQAGGGEQVAWRPDWKGFDPVTTSAGGFVLRAYRLTPADRAAIAAAAARLRPSTADIITAAQARWKAGWMQCRTALTGNYAVRAYLLASPDKSAWGGWWTFASGAGRTTRAEIDFAETTGAADGTVLLRQQLHGIDPVTGKWSTWPERGCPAILKPNRSVWAGYRVVGNRLTWTLDGRDTCSIDLPAGLNVPQLLIASNMVGGAAKPSDDATPMMSFAFGWPAVTVLP